MKLRNTANRPLNKQAIALEEAESEIRLIVKNEYLKKTPKPQIDSMIKKVIDEALKKIKIPSLREAGAKSLIRFYNQQYSEIKTILGGDVDSLVLLIALANGQKPRQEQKTFQTLQSRGFMTEYDSTAKLYGVPLKEYSQDYLKKRVEPIMRRMSEEQPKEDPRGLTIRSKAELEVRYQEHIDELNDLKQKGVKLVICSTHADCSERCAPWQGRVYSLDGTTGTTDDGRKYVPLEVATQRNFTKKGVPNGLLGYNCRHYLVPYESGFKFPKPNKKEEEKEYAITLKQRQLERNVYAWKNRALSTFDKEEKQKATEKARYWNKVYINFSKANDRAYYPSRTKILNRESGK